MSIDISTITFNQLVWIILVVLGLGVVFVVVRFFFHHILKHLIQGCIFILLVLAILALLHYFRVF